MKSRLNLPAFLRIIFGYAYRFSIIMGIIFVVCLVVPLFFPNLATNEFLSVGRRITYNNLSINLLGQPVSLKTTNSESSPIGFLTLRGDLLLLVDSKDPALVSAIYLTLIPTAIIGTLYYTLLFGLLRDLCRRIERGEVFSGKNLGSVKNVGLLLIIGNLAGAACMIWSSQRLGAYLHKNATVTGIDATIDFGISNLPRNFDFAGLVTGLLVLLIAEAFRQGLILKKENELTV